MDYTGLARSTVYKYMADEQFPKPVKLGVRVVAWVEAEIHDWVLAKIAERDLKWIKFVQSRLNFFVYVSLPNAFSSGSTR